MFSRRPEWKRLGGLRAVTITLDGVAIPAIEGDSVAAAVLAAKPGHTRLTPVSGAPRAPYCMMGVCFECLMHIDGVANRQACMIRVRDGMVVRRQSGLPGIADKEPVR
jgi:D-hydroxyproline dehydrogenase subunit gamma